MTETVIEVPDPRIFPDAGSVAPEAASLHALAGASLAADTRTARRRIRSRAAASTRAPPRRRRGDACGIDRQRPVGRDCAASVATTRCCLARNDDRSSGRSRGDRIRHSAGRCRGRRGGKWRDDVARRARNAAATGGHSQGAPRPRRQPELRARRRAVRSGRDRPRAAAGALCLATTSRRVRLRRRVAPTCACARALGARRRPRRRSPALSRGVRRGEPGCRSAGRLRRRCVGIAALARGLAPARRPRGDGTGVTACSESSAACRLAGSNGAARSRCPGLCEQCDPQAARVGGRARGRDQRPSRGGRAATRANCGCRSPRRSSRATPKDSGVRCILWTVSATSSRCSRAFSRIAGLRTSGSFPACTRIAIRQPACRCCSSPRRFRRRRRLPFTDRGAHGGRVQVRAIPGTASADSRFLTRPAPLMCWLTTGSPR